jgi:cysteine synthase A
MTLASTSTSSVRAPGSSPGLRQHESGTSHDWGLRAIKLLDDEKRRSADTHLRELAVPAFRGIRVFLKDESTHPTGSLKHRLASSLFYDAICSGYIDKGTVVVESSSGSTAVSEAYFAQLLGLKFIAVMPEATSPLKIEAIRRFGGQCHLIAKASDVYGEAARLARESGGYYLDQFTNAARVTDWRGDNIAQSMFTQLGEQAEDMPQWVVMGVGTGGTSSTIGRFIRYRRLPTRLCVVDVERSAFFDAVVSGNGATTVDLPSRIEGVGRQRVEPSFVATVVDHMIKVPDAASIAAAHVLSDRLYHRVGASTGTNFFGVCCLVGRMLEEGRQGSVLSVICDSGERYRNTYYDPAWLAEQKIDIKPYLEILERFLDTGRLALP